VVKSLTLAPVQKNTRSPIEPAEKRNRRTMSARTRLILSTLGALVLLMAIVVPLALAEDTWYRVRPGDYLFRIAERFGTSVAQLKSDNGLTGDLIYPEQKLRITGLFSRSTSTSVVWRSPFAGRAGETLRPFGDLANGSVTTRHSGLDMAFPRNSRVVAPAHGVIRYLGEQDGYGLLMILDHGAGFVTVLGPFDAQHTYVQPGQVVSRGDGLGLTGAPVETGQPYLHIELRRDNKAVDPARLMR
jgi:murein DD-endopeptidase MepM/ murein hydrolase activator NlpD